MSMRLRTVQAHVFIAKQKTVSATKATISVQTALLLSKTRTVVQRFAISVSLTLAPGGRFVSMSRATVVRVVPSMFKRVGVNQCHFRAEHGAVARAVNPSARKESVATWREAAHELHVAQRAVARLDTVNFEVAQLGARRATRAASRGEWGDGLFLRR
jgi:hypothetical protein